MTHNDNHDTGISRDVKHDQTLQPDPALQMSTGRVGRGKIALAAALAAAIVVVVVYGMNQEAGQPDTANTPSPTTTASSPPSGPTNNPADQPARQDPQQQAAQPENTQQGGQRQQSDRGDAGQEQSNQPAAPTGRADSAVGGDSTGAAPRQQAPAQ